MSLGFYRNSIRIKNSFTYNLVQYFSELGQEVVVERNDKISLKEIKNLNPEFLVLSPGPCTPNEAGISLDISFNFNVSWYC